MANAWFCLARPWFTFNVSVDNYGEGVLSAFAANGAKALACAASRVPSIVFASMSKMEDTLWQLIFTRGSSYAPKSTVVLTLLQSVQNSGADSVPQKTRMPTRGSGSGFLVQSLGACCVIVVELLVICGLWDVSLMQVIKSRNSIPT